ncbi:hypothetical protein MHYP_G00311420 [Metynnis hypsauchen]
MLEMENVGSFDVHGMLGSFFATFSMDNNKTASSHFRPAFSSPLASNMLQNAKPFKDAASHVSAQEKELKYLESLLAYHAGKPLLLPSTVAIPCEYNGEEACDSFIVQSTIYFQHLAFPTPPGCIKMLFIRPLLNGKALQWADIILSKRATEALSKDFLNWFQAQFSQPVSPPEASVDNAAGLSAANNVVSWPPFQFSRLL